MYVLSSYTKSASSVFPKFPKTKSVLQLPNVQPLECWINISTPKIDRSCYTRLLNSLSISQKLPNSTIMFLPPVCSNTNCYPRIIVTASSAPAAKKTSN
jgi:hypothetical protein